jgi:nicotinamide mononucleotide adenylyltransferase
MHLQILESARDYARLDLGLDVLGGFVSPVHDAYGKKSLVDAKHRISMCVAATQDSSWIAVGGFETGQSGWTPTHEVIGQLRESMEEHLECKGVRVLMVCGADLVASLRQPDVWADHEIEALVGCEGVGILALERGDVSVEQIVDASDRLRPHRARIHGVPQRVVNDVSSSIVRQLIKESRSIKYLTHDGVVDYIGEHKLYSGIDAGSSSDGERPPSGQQRPTSHAL